MKEVWKRYKIRHFWYTPTLTVSKVDNLENCSAKNVYTKSCNHLTFKKTTPLKKHCLRVHIDKQIW